METKKLNLGCGPSWESQYPDYIGLDIHDYGQTFSRNAITFFKDILEGVGMEADQINTFDEVMANHFMEHFDQDQLQILFQGVSRILKLGGIFKIVVPHMKKDKSWVLSHKTFWNEETFKWLERTDADSVYGFGTWKVAELVVNDRLDIHCKLIKI